MQIPLTKDFEFYKNASSGIGENDLRCECAVSLFRDNVEVASVKGGFDLFLALSPRWQSHCQSNFETLLKLLIAAPALFLVLDYCAIPSATPGKAQATQPPQMLKVVEPGNEESEKPSSQDLRIHCAIRVFGKNVEVFSMDGGFQMPGILRPGSTYYDHKFKSLFETLVTSPAYGDLIRFYTARESLLKGEQQPSEKNDGPVRLKEQPLHFGSADFHPEAPEIPEVPEAERKVA